MLDMEGGKEGLELLGGNKVRTNRDHLHKDKPLFVDELIAKNRKSVNTHKPVPKKKDNLKLLSMAIANYFEYNKKQEKKASVLPQREPVEVKKKPGTKFNSLLEPKPVTNLAGHKETKQRTYIHYEERKLEVEHKTNQRKDSTSIPKHRPNGLNDNTPKANTWRITMHEGGCEKSNLQLARDKTILKMLHPSQSQEKRLKPESFNRGLGERQDGHHKKRSVFTACINSINKKTEKNLPKMKTPTNGGGAGDGNEHKQVYSGLEVEQKGYFYKPDLKKKEHETKLYQTNKFDGRKEIKSMLEGYRFNNKENVSGNMTPSKFDVYERDLFTDELGAQALKDKYKPMENNISSFGKLIRRNKVENLGMANTEDRRIDSSLLHRKKKSMMPVPSEERGPKEKLKMKRPHLGLELLSKKWKQEGFPKDLDTDRSLSQLNRSEGVIIDKSKLSSESSLVALDKDLVCQEENLNLDLSSGCEPEYQGLYATEGLAGGACGEGSGEAREEYHLIYDEDLYRNLLASEEEYVVNPHYQEGRQIRWNMRAILFDWMIEVSDDFSLKRSTFYYAIYYVDQYLAVTPSVTTKNLQLIGVTALDIAAKLEEIYVPVMADFAMASLNTFHVDQIKETELKMLKVGSL
jgi:hypothetical protein